MNFLTHFLCRNLKSGILFLLIGFALIGNSKITAQETTHSISFFEDPGNVYSPEKLDLKKFKKSANNSLNFGFYQGTIWVLISSDSPSKEEIIEFKNSNLDILTFFSIDSNQFKYDLQMGDYFPFDARPLKNRFFKYPNKGNDSILVKIENFGDQLFIPIVIQDNEQINEQSYDEQIIFGSYYGLCLFAFLLNLFLYLRIREAANLFYAMYLIGIVLLQLALDGHGFQFLWSDSVFIAQHAPPFFASFSVLFLLLFTQYFLSTKVIVPRIHFIFNIIRIVLIVNCILSLLPSYYAFSILLINIATLLLNISILPLAIVAIRKQFRPARYFLAAFTLLILCVFTFILRNFGIIPSSFFADYSLQIGSTAEIVLLSYAIVDKFNSYKEDALNSLKKINKIQAEQNMELEKEVALRMERITEQRDQIELKNKEIIDSINYAKRIQDALIPTRKEVTAVLPESFIIWKPKDIVSGDFYWVSQVVTTKKDEENSKLVLCVVGDCTGHGVPGAILSVLGLKILNLSLKNPLVNTTSDAMNYLNDEFARTFSIGKENALSDGMDIGFCAIDFDQLNLYFSGAKNGIYIIRNNELIEIKGDRFSIGSTDNSLSFEQHIFKLIHNDLIVLYSDGYADQFGGPRNKKLKYQTLKDLLVAHSAGPIEELESELNSAFMQWKGNTEQTDDVCLLGFRV